MDKLLGRSMKAPVATADKKKRPRAASDGSIKKVVKTATVAAPVNRQRKVRVDVTLHNNPVKARKYAALDEFGAGEILREDGGLLLCIACNKHVRFEKKTDVRQHFTGARSKTKPRKTGKLSHEENVASLKEQLKKQEAMIRALEINRQQVWERDHVNVKGATLPKSVQAERAQVLEDMFVLSIPTHRLDDQRLVRLIEQKHADLGGKMGVRQQFPVVQALLSERLRATLDGQLVAIFFDASKVNQLIEAVICRLLDKDLMPTQVCFGVGLVPKSIDSASLQLLLRHHLREANVEMRNVVCGISDSGPPNPTAMKEWNEGVKAVYFGDRLKEESLLWIPCLMHAMSNCGTVLRKKLPLVKQFMSGFKRMTNTSDAARKLWSEICGAACPGLAEKSFWAWWDCAKKILAVWQYVKAFLAKASARTLAEKSVRKMKLVFDDAASFKCLTAEMNFVVIAGQTFHEAGFMLEGDGFCLPYAKRYLSVTQTLLAEWLAQKTAHISVTSVVDVARQNGLLIGQCEMLTNRLGAALQAVHTQASNAIFKKMDNLMPFYTAAGLFCPKRLVVQMRRADWPTVFDAAVEQFVGLKGVTVPNLRTLLTAELVVLQRLAAERLNTVYEDIPAELWMWWRRIRDDVPTWFLVAKVLVLMQPTSAAVERFYSIVKANTSARQVAEAEETFACRTMVLYNYRKE